MRRNGEGMFLEEASWEENRKTGKGVGRGTGDLKARNQKEAEEAENLRGTDQDQQGESLGP